MTISVIGLGKLGLPLAATIASKGNLVIGVDVNESELKRAQKLSPDYTEPLLNESLIKNSDKLTFTTDTKKAILESEMTFMVTPTPSLKNGKFSTKYLEEVAREIGKALKVKDSYHLVVIVSTVLPGDTEKIKRIIERESAKIAGFKFGCGHEFGLCYSPEFIALGSIIKNLLNPDFVLIGESDKHSGELLEKFYKDFCENTPKVSRMNFTNAELSKIALNTYITTKISYANMLSEICERLPGGNVDEVTSAIGQDSRIGLKYLKGGVAFGGPCFPRDNLAFIYLSNKHNLQALIPKSTHKINQNQNTRLTKTVLKNISPGDTVGIIGVSYKTDTAVMEESAGFLVLDKLINEKLKIMIYDPLASQATKNIYGDKISYAKSLKECLENCQIIVITVDYPELKDLNLNDLKDSEKIIIDPWRLYTANNLPHNIRYIPLGTYQPQRNNGSLKDKKIKTAQKMRGRPRTPITAN